MLVPRCASHTVLSGNEIQRWAKHVVPGMECLRTRVRFPPPPPMPRATREGGPFLVRFVVFRTGAFLFDRTGTWVISTPRFSARPVTVLFLAIWRFSPAPTVIMLSRITRRRSTRRAEEREG